MERARAETSEHRFVSCTALNEASMSAMADAFSEGQWMLQSTRPLAKPAVKAFASQWKPNQPWQSAPWHTAFHWKECVPHKLWSDSMQETFLVPFFLC